MLLVTPEREPALGELVLDLVDALLAEVGDVEQLGLRLGDQVADGLDALALEAVVRTDAELELLDEHVVHAAAGRRRGEALDGELLAAARAVGVGEDRHPVDEDLGGLAEGLLGHESAVRRDVEDELVVVSTLADARALD